MSASLETLKAQADAAARAYREALEAQQVRQKTAGDSLIAKIKAFLADNAELVKLSGAVGFHVSGDEIRLSFTGRPKKDPDANKKTADSLTGNAANKPAAKPADETV